VALVGQLAHPGGELHLASRVPPLPAVGAVGVQQVRGIEAAQERRRDADEVGRLPDRQGRVVGVVEAFDAHVALLGARRARAPAGCAQRVLAGVVVGADRW
jgi:hypothetical protein